MCGRYAQTKSARAAARRLAQREDIPAVRPETWNLAPGTKSLVVRAWSDGTITEWLTWGFRDPEAKGQPPINARVESAPYVWLFKDAWKGQRCVVPADGWYEWKEGRGGKQPYYFRQRSGHTLFFAGLWTGTSFAILTAAADGDLGSIHGRRPLALDFARAEDWIREAPRDGDSLVAQMLPGSEIEFHPVTGRVGSVRNDGPDLILEVPPSPPRLETMDLFPNSE